MIGKTILAFINKRRQSVTDWLKGEDAQVPTDIIKGIAVQCDWQIICNAYNISETMEQLQLLKDEINKDVKVLHLTLQTNILMGPNGANVPVEHQHRYYCEKCGGETKPSYVPICSKCKTELQLAIQEDG